VARPFLDRLGDVTGETVNLGVASNGMVEQIAQVDSTVPDRRDQLGRALGAAALRGTRQGAARLRRRRSCPGRLEQRTARTITSRAALRPTSPR
jgi:DNA-binding IclR family transcriptional regulator